MDSRPRRRVAKYGHSWGSDAFIMPRKFSGVASNPDYTYPKGSSRQIALDSMVDQAGNRYGLARSLATYTRKSMGNDVTRNMLAYGANHENKMTDSFRRVSANMSATGEANLSDLGVNRNHILADSSVASVLHHSLFTVYHQGGGTSDKQRAAISGFFGALAGHDTTARDSSMFSFFEAMRHGPGSYSTGHLNSSIHQISRSMGNLRFGHGPENVDIGGHFDPNTYERGGEMTNRSRAIMEATQHLGRVGLVPQELIASSLIRPLDEHNMPAGSSNVPGEHPDTARRERNRNKHYRKTGVFAKRRQIASLKRRGGIVKPSQRNKGGVNSRVIKKVKNSAFARVLRPRPFNKFSEGK